MSIKPQSINGKECRFIEGIHYFIDKNNCHVWAHSKTRDGYGNVYWQDKLQRTHRLSYQIKFGQIPRGLGVLHKCDNRACLNPEHLFLGTQQDNVTDMINKCRRQGVLTPDDIPLIRELRNMGLTHKVIAEKFGASRNHITNILNGRRWANY